MLNPNLDNWNFNKTEMPEIDKPVFILVESDTWTAENEDMDSNSTYYNMDEFPFVRCASLGKDEIAYYWKLIDCNYDSEESVLRQNFSVIAWRYLGKEEIVWIVNEYDYIPA